MPKKRRNNNNNGQFHKNGIHKTHFKKGQYNDRKKYISPHLITDDLDEDLERRDNRNQNYQRKDNQNKKKIYEKLEKMTTTKEQPKKLAIGDTDDSTKKPLLASTMHCKLSNDTQNVFEIIVKFLQDYFTCYDTNRDSLLAAYNTKVLFSLSINSSNSGAYRTFKFDDYIKESRNLKRVFATDDYSLEKRYKMLHQGHIDTVNFLRKLPPTEHDPSTFKLDHCFFTPQMVTFSVVGVFKEGKATDKVRPLRSFQRTFVCIPDANTTMSIINELYVIANISTEQYRNFYKDKLTDTKKAPPTTTTTTENLATTSATATTSSSIPTTSQAPVGLPSDLTEVQKQMIQEFSAKSKLNLIWSHDCLQQSNWNFEAAAQLFMQFSSQIPADAFLK